MVVVVSIDIEGAFDNAWWPAMINELEKKKIDRSISRLISSYLTDRQIKLTYAGSEITKPTNKGCIQGSICGPLLWNLQLDPLLREIEDLGIHIQAYADDILIIAKGKAAEDLEREINTALGHILVWARTRKMKLAAQKTQAILLTRKIKYGIPKLLLNNTVIRFSESVTILGLTIDANLNFKNHVDSITEKAIQFYKKVARTARANWGLNPEILRTIYITVVEPTVLYAAGAWGLTASKKQIKVRLDRITRIFAIMICKAHRTASLVSSTILARILPLDLRAIENAEMYRIKRGKPIMHLPGRRLAKPISPHTLPHPANRTRLQYGMITSETDIKCIENNWPCIYTDGSKISGKVGAAITCWKDGEEIHKAKLKLGNHCSVYQAELAAILRATEIMLSRRLLKEANILTDSRSALECLTNPNTLHPIAAEILDRISEIERKQGKVGLFWVKAHSGIQGNERADELAKSAAETSKQTPVYDCFPLSFAKRHIRDNTLQIWQELYTTSNTGRVTKKFFPNVIQAYATLKKIKINNLRCQIFTGHGGFKAYLHKFKLAQSPHCECDHVTPQTIEHILIDCPRYDSQRLCCEHRVGFAIKEETLCRAVNDDDSRTHFLVYAERCLRNVLQENGSKIY